MHTTFKSALLAASMLVCLSAKAYEIDGLNQSSLPGYIDLSGSSDTVYAPQKFEVDFVTYQYTPTFDYTLTGLYTRFARSGPLPVGGTNSINVRILTANTDPTSSSAFLLQSSFSFKLKLGTVDLLPDSPYDLNFGTDWLGTDSFGALSLKANVSYYIELSRSADMGSFGLLSLTNVGVNTASTGAPSTIPTGSPYTWLPTYVNGQLSVEPVYTAPIFSFRGTPASPVPEPSTYGLIGAFGLMGFAAYRRRFSRKS